MLEFRSRSTFELASCQLALERVRASGAVNLFSELGPISPTLLAALEKIAPPGSPIRMILREAIVVTVAEEGPMQV